MAIQVAIFMALRLCGFSVSGVGLPDIGLSVSLISRLPTNFQNGTEMKIQKSIFYFGA